MKRFRPLRTRFAQDIVAEFAVPRRDTGKVIIACLGMPSYPSGGGKIIETWTKKGYWVIVPRYRGTWESGGRFLKRSPYLDVLDVIDQLPRGFTELHDRQRFRVKPKQLTLFGRSFGGPAVLLAGRDRRVDKVVASSPVVDWLAPSKDEPLGWLGRYVREAFGEGYRYAQRDYDKLKGGTFYNPIAHASEIPGDKVLIFHARDDRVVSWTSVYRFVKRVNCRFVSYAKGEHWLQSFERPASIRRIEKFLRGK
ncbi:MAG: prolyl oligopeptidase family serine peptidase [Candidatus Kerfeldbacteria bacterium]|nr:prolyl oligopeptidase family serine peptidase [Candidatus Kerfeldbacteria bacterium]